MLLVRIFGYISFGVSSYSQSVERLISELLKAPQKHRALARSPVLSPDRGVSSRSARDGIRRTGVPAHWLTLRLRRLHRYPELDINLHIQYCPISEASRGSRQGESLTRTHPPLQGPLPSRHGILGVVAPCTPLQPRSRWKRSPWADGRMGSAPHHLESVAGLCAPAPCRLAPEGL